MGWDSNPRDALTPAGFQDRCLQPLGHPSPKRYRRLTNFAWGCKPGILRRTGVGKVVRCLGLPKNVPRWRQGQRGGKLQVAEGESQSATYIAIYNYRRIHSPIKYHLWVKKRALEAKALGRRWRRTTGGDGAASPSRLRRLRGRPLEVFPGGEDVAAVDLDGPLDLLVAEAGDVDVAEAVDAAFQLDVEELLGPLAVVQGGGDGALDGRLAPGPAEGGPGGAGAGGADLALGRLALLRRGGVARGDLGHDEGLVVRLVQIGVELAVVAFGCRQVRAAAGRQQRRQGQDPDQGGATGQASRSSHGGFILSGLSSLRRPRAA